MLLSSCISFLSICYLDCSFVHFHRNLTVFNGVCQILCNTYIEILVMCEASKDQAYVICNQTHELDLSVKQTNNRTLDKTSQLRL